MAYWVWDPAFSVGIAVIDQQHKRLIDYINELNNAQRYNDKAKVQTVLWNLIDYTISHFSFEESLMQEAGYAMFEAHKKVHEAFIKRIEFFQARYQNGEDMTRQLMNELQIWLTHHIQHDDKDYQQSVKAMLEKKQLKAEHATNEGWIKSLVDKFFA
jgi:hemerythrin